MILIPSAFNSNPSPNYKNDSIYFIIESFSVYKSYFSFLSYFYICYVKHRALLNFQIESVLYI